MNRAMVVKYFSIDQLNEFRAEDVNTDSNLQLMYDVHVFQPYNFQKSAKAKQAYMA